MPIRISLLGPLAVTVDDQPVSVGGMRPRLLLARLAASAPTAVRADRLVDAIWGDEAPAKAANTLQVHVSNVRRALGTDADGNQIVRTEANGYSLAVEASQLDIFEFNQLVRAGRAASAQEEHAQAAVVFRQALDLPRGEPFADLLDNEWAVAESGVLARQIDGAWREWAEAELSAGHHLAVIPALEDRLREDALNEGVAAMLVLALYRAGKQTDSLRVLSNVRRRLADEVGVDPGPELLTLENRIFAHDPGLQIDRTSAPLVEATRIRGAETVAVLEVGGRRLMLADDLITVGRDQDQHIVIDDVDVSRQHALIERVASGFRLSDRGSTNGTMVNGERIEDSIVLTDGDQIWLGSTVATFVLHSS